MAPSVVEGGMPSWHAMDDAMPFPYFELALMAILLKRIASECRFGRFCHRMRTSCPFLYIIYMWRGHFQLILAIWTHEAIADCLKSGLV